MYVEHLPDGRIKYGMYYRDWMTGKKKRVTVVYSKDTRTNRLAAQDTLTDRIRKLTAEATPPKDMTLAELTRRYLEYQKSTVKLSTYDRNMRFCNSTLRIVDGDSLVSRLTPEYIKKCFDAYTDAPGAKNERLRRFKALWRWAYQQGYVPDTTLIDRIRPWKDVPHKSKIQDKYLEKDELRLLLNEMDIPLWRDLTEFMALSGCRIGEAAALTAVDVDFDEKVIKIEKTLNEKHRIVTDPKTFTSQRRIYIQRELLPLVRLLVNRSGGGLLFSFNGDYINYYSYNKYLRETTNAIIGRPLTTHALRHTHTSLCAEAGMDLADISRRLGHADSKVTREVYLHVTKNMEQRANDKMDTITMLS